MTRINTLTNPTKMVRKTLWSTNITNYAKKQRRDISHE